MQTSAGKQDVPVTRKATPNKIRKSNPEEEQADDAKNVEDAGKSRFANGVSSEHHEFTSIYQLNALKTA